MADVDLSGADLAGALMVESVLREVGLVGSDLCRARLA
ncbi:MULTISPECIES: pentapeptide repeat-containing protein [unclassified Streptomyces]